MAKRIEIISQSVIITDTDTGVVLFDAPKAEYYYKIDKLVRENKVELYNLDHEDNISARPPILSLGDVVNSSDVAFTVATFQDFARTNLGFKTASGSSGAVDSVNGQTGVVVLNPDDLNDTSTTNKFTSAAEISKLAGIEAGAEVNTVTSVNGLTGEITLLEEAINFETIGEAVNISLNSFDAGKFVLGADTTITFIDTPERGVVVVKTLEINGAFSLSFPQATKVIGTYVNDGTTVNFITIQFAYYQGIGDQLTIIINQ